MPSGQRSHSSECMHTKTLSAATGVQQCLGQARVCEREGSALGSWYRHQKHAAGVYQHDIAVVAACIKRHGLGTLPVVCPADPVQPPDVPKLGLTTQLDLSFQQLASA